MKVLILGGNRFVGRRLALEFINSKDEVTLLNRGKCDDGLGNKVKRLVANRREPQELLKAIEGKSWDIVFDQICYTASEAQAACEIFKNKTKRYIVISSQSVYDEAANLKEEDFDPYTYSIKREADPYKTNEDYQEAKRQVEFVFATQKNFPACFIRFPYIIGEDDYTKRFFFHVERIKNNQEIYFSNPKSRLSFIYSLHAGKALHALSQIEYSGPLNLASPTPYSLEYMAESIGKFLNKKVEYSKEQTKENLSTYDIDGDAFMNVDRALKLGIPLPELEKIFPEMLSLIQTPKP